MNPKILLCLALVLSGGLFGCSTAVRGASKATPAQTATNSFRGHGWDDISSHIFGIEGKIVRIRKTAGVLRSISVKLIRPLPTALGYIPYEKPGETIVIHFDESLSELGSLQLATGSIVKVAFGEVDSNLKEPPKWGTRWGSNFSWLYVGKNGAFYNTKGEILESEPDSGFRTIR